MALNKNQMNRFAAALLETLPAEGVPESYLYLAGERVGMTLEDFNVTTTLLIGGGLLVRNPGPRIAPGPAFEKVKAAYLKSQG